MLHTVLIEHLYNTHVPNPVVSYCVVIQVCCERGVFKNIHCA